MLKKNTEETYSSTKVEKTDDNKYSDKIKEKQEKSKTEEDKSVQHITSLDSLINECNFTEDQKVILKSGVLGDFDKYFEEGYDIQVSTSENDTMIMILNPDGKLERVFKPMGNDIFQLKFEDNYCNNSGANHYSVVNVEGTPKAFDGLVGLDPAFWLGFYDDIEEARSMRNHATSNADFRCPNGVEWYKQKLACKYGFEIDYKENLSEDEIYVKTRV